MAQRLLPAVLREVSGVAIDRQGRLHLVQDERGVRYVYDWAADRITDEVRWAEDGDFEGIATDADTTGAPRFWMIRSDGWLYAAFAERPSVSERLEVGYWADFEGVGFDAQRQQLWVVSKEAASPSVQHLYGVHPETLEINGSLALSKAALRRYCARSGMACDWSNEAFPLSPSGIAVHPITGHIYVLAAREHALCVLDDTGEVLFLGQFSEGLLPQAEGIAFFENGDLVLASEDDRRGRLVRFAYRDFE